MATFDLNKIFQDTFGYKPQEFNITEEQLFTKSKEGNYGEYYKKDVMGRDVFMPVTLAGMRLNYCWVRVTGKKRIVDTPLTERRGSVKEFVSMDDYKISIKGFFIGHKGEFPEADIAQWKDTMEVNEAIEISSVLTDIFLLTPEHGGQDRVVVEDFELMDNQGIEHVRGYQISLVSDQIFELEIE
jgi:hypothetical protein